MKTKPNSVIVFLAIVIASVNLPAQSYSEKLIKLIPYNNIEKAKTLISKGADVNYVDKKGRTALVEACFWNKSEIVEILLNNGADISKRGTLINKELVLPVEAAMLLTGEEVLTVLFTKGAEIDFYSEQGWRYLNIGIKNAKRMAEYYKTEKPDIDTERSFKRIHQLLKEKLEVQTLLKTKEFLMKEENISILNKLKKLDSAEIQHSDFLELINGFNIQKPGKIGIVGAAKNHNEIAYDLGFYTINEYDNSLEFETFCNAKFSKFNQIKVENIKGEIIGRSKSISGRTEDKESQIIHEFINYSSYLKGEDGNPIKLDCSVNRFEFKQMQKIEITNEKRIVKLKIESSVDVGTIFFKDNKAVRWEINSAIHDK